MGKLKVVNQKAKIATIIQFKDLFMIAEWQKFYNELFGIKINFSNISIPERKKGFNRLIIVAQGITPQQIYDKCAEFFFCWKCTYQNLDECVYSERSAKNGSYAVWFRKVIEPDRELRSLSANNLKKRGIVGITLEERLLMELKYFKETGNHLDRKYITLCSGSRYSNGAIPGVHWDSVDCELGVGCLSPWFSNFGLRSRRAIL
ncbi:MAG TPA: hypothetical protein PLL80_00060 [Candidatus Pacearchaeota archaeon]|nr:hypothetical protein [Candidatus Pacearchaeota archaeon]HOK93927.1 hypothetical protein [Candidatus Pacearchaeota archaeon]HPO74998.1 hypothetical protein [Candidatus Pacearchaeota archaeon]